MKVKETPAKLIKHEVPMPVNVTSLNRMEIYRIRNDCHLPEKGSINADYLCPPGRKKVDELVAQTEWFYLRRRDTF